MSIEGRDEIWADEFGMEHGFLGDSGPLGCSGPLGSSGPLYRGGPTVSSKIIVSKIHKSELR